MTERTMVYSVMWKKFVRKERNGVESISLETEVRSNLTEAAKDALLHECLLNGIMASVSRYESRKVC